MEELPPERMDTSKEQAEEVYLWRRWRECNDVGAREKLIEMYCTFARAMAARLYSLRSNDDVEFHDYFQFAQIGLMEAIDRYEPFKETKFTTFAYARIKGAVLSGLEKMTERYQQSVVFRRLEKERLQSLKDGVSIPEKENVETLFQYLADIGITLALGILLEEDGSEDLQHGWGPDDNYQRFEVKQFAIRLRYYLSQLTDREQKVIQGIYLQQMSFDEVATMLGITKGRVSQLHSQALIRMRTLLNVPVPNSIIW